MGQSNWTTDILGRYTLTPDNLGDRQFTFSDMFQDVMLDCLESCCTQAAFTRNLCFFPFWANQQRDQILYLCGNQYSKSLFKVF